MNNKKVFWNVYKNSIHTSIVRFHRQISNNKLHENYSIYSQFGTEIPLIHFCVIKKRSSDLSFWQLR